MTDPTIKQLVASSSLAFTGTAQARGIAAEAGLPADDHTTVVQVEQVLHAPAGFAVPTGSTVTVQTSADLPYLEPGQRATFFANGLAYGDQLTVAEVGRLPADAGTARTESLAGVIAPVSAVHAALAELAQDNVAEHAAQADAVVRGYVSALAEVAHAGPFSENDAHWWSARLQVDLVARGDVGRQPDGGPVPVTVLYANSQDQLWYRWLKPKAGQAGLWLLHRTPEERAELAPFEVRHSMDLQESRQLDLLRERGI
jgi:hypothetical protein